MSEPYFNTPEKIAQLQFHAAQWLGTPFMPNASVKGIGVSCQKLVGSIYITTGFFAADFEIPEAPMDWSNAHKESLVEKAVAAQGGFMEVQQPAPGDMLGIKLGGCIHHCGLVMTADGKFIHCLRGQGVVFSSMRDASYLSRIGKIWRPVL